ncbi:signal peptide-containing protein [Theileria equi strain WA]|uniref:Signal peptide-containing protein n=1 Tax=Theileria equi strain WA TaxID=1537102 RepID=L0AWC9_THEEQ|nr:signal peptide-containing protein [Theileria equi strain WA]AFZ79214.1 signal peptide-containing protein [Theileria equi strain WA]|eukprot:XP_004828880.1 signal peptide-containing protein [Theileria equi strain WA]
MRVLAVLWTVCLVRFCSAACWSCFGGSKTDKDKIPSDKHTPSASKVDSTLFDVSESNSDGVPLLTCTPKPNIVVTEFKYGDETIWSGNKSVLFLSALIYFDEDKPYIVTLQYWDKDKYHTLFLHYNGDEWEDNQEEYAKKLNILKGVPPPATQSTGKTSVLDLLNPDVESVHVGGGDEDGLAKRVFTPNSGHHISSVVDSGATLWKAKRDGEKCTLVESYSKGESMLAYLKLESATGLDLKYLERVNGEWKEVTITEFYHRLEEMRKKKEKSINKDMEKHLQRAKKRLEENKKVTTKSPTPITLDLSNPDDSKVNVYKEEDEGVKFEDYSPKEGHHISSVVDAGKELWKAEAGQKCFLTKSYTKDDISFLVIVINGSDYGLDLRYFEKTGGAWRPIEKDDFLKKLNGMSGHNPTTPIALDLTDPDESKINMDIKDSNGVSYRGFMPKPGSKITSVMDNGALVWRASGDEKCTGGNIYGKGGSLLLDVSTIGEDKFNVKYFEKKTNGQWISIALDDFLNKFDEMSEPRLSSSNPSSSHPSKASK